MGLHSSTELKLFILGSALGNPMSPKTYSGIPYHLFEEFRHLDCLVGVANSYTMKPVDVFTGRLDFHRSLRTFRLRKNVLWRYRKSGMEILSKRLQQTQRRMPSHNVVFQIGVGAIPTPEVKLVAHVEISVAAAVNSKIFSQTYGFAGHSFRAIAEAIEGEKRFLDRCSMIWTNSEWTAQTIKAQGVDESRIRIYPPAAGINDPGTVERDWHRCHILFVGNKWYSKGGELLVEAFKAIRKVNRNASLSIVGCTPNIDVPGVSTVRYLRKDHPKEQAMLDSLYRKATIFCMPSYWESTGIVYMEAALWGLPVVMLKGQGREKIFPSSMAIHISRPDAQALAEALLDLSRSPSDMERMGRCGRKLMLERYTWNKLARKLYDDIKEMPS